MSFTLNQENRDFSFTISIPANDEIGRSRERVFTLGVQDISAISDKYRITPHQLGILIKDNDTGWWSSHKYTHMHSHASVKVECLHVRLVIIIYKLSLFGIS